MNATKKHRVVRTPARSTPCVVLYPRNAKIHEYKSVGGKKGNGTRAGWQNVKSCKFVGVMERRATRTNDDIRRRDFGMIQILNYNASHEEEER